MKLDPATIVTGGLEAARSFLCSVVGLSEGPRPPFGIGGHWLYADGRPAVHLIEAPGATSARPTSPRIYHVGFLVSTAEECSSMLARMQVSVVFDQPYELA